MFSPETLIGLIMMLVIGPALGNYATSVVYRLPKGETPFEKHPYCGDCGTMLQPKDLFPLWSFIFSRGKCNHCGVKIRPMYFLIELAALVICVAHFLLFGIGEFFLILTGIGLFWLILAAIEWHEKFVSLTMVGFTAALIAIWRVLGDVSIYPMIESMFVALVCALVFWKVFQRKKHSSPPHYISAVALLGLAVPMAMLPQAVLAYLVVYGLLRLVAKNPHYTHLAAGLAWWCGALYNAA